MILKTKKALKSFSTLSIGDGNVHSTIVYSKNQLEGLVAYCLENSLKIICVGHGSNICWASDQKSTILIKIGDTSISRIIEADDRQDSKSLIRGKQTLRVGAGTTWDSFVETMCCEGFAGAEALSAIPGTVGAAPIQNIGAYGVEFADICKSVLVYDAQELEWKTFSSAECLFSYRESIFKKQEFRDRYIVWSVDITLDKSQVNMVPKYKDIQGIFLKKQGVEKSEELTQASVLDIRKEIIKIRWGKLPKPEELANCGSFFKNPKISKTDFLILQKKFEEDYESIPHYPVKVKNINNNQEGQASKDYLKLSAGWLIQEVGFKGYIDEKSKLGIYENHALILVNHSGQATAEDLTNFVSMIIEKVDEKFGVVLEPEVRLL